MALRLRAARPLGAEIELEWQDGRRCRLPCLWLRDHARGPEGLDPQTQQRAVDTFALPPDLAAVHAEVGPEGAELEVAWAGDGGTASRFPADFLADMAGLSPAPRPARTLWDAATIEARQGPPAVSHQTVMAGAAGLRAWLEQVERFGFCLVRGVPASPQATRALAERIGYLRQTIFGDLWDFTADLAHKDSAYTTSFVDLHTDGTYSLDPPGLQLFHCLAFEGRGGDSLLADGFRAAERLRAEAPEAFRLLTEVAVPAQYIEPGVHLGARHPVLRLDAAGGLAQVCFNNYDRAPFFLPDGRMAAFYEALRAFHDRVAAPESQLRFRLTPGEVLLFDNWRVLHGRAAYEGRRRLCGCYLNREDFESRLRVLRSAA